MTAFKDGRLSFILCALLILLSTVKLVIDLYSLPQKAPLSKSAARLVIERQARSGNFFKSTKLNESESLARQYMLAGEYDEAASTVRAALARAEKQNPEQIPDLYLALGDILRDSGRYARAQDAYIKAWREAKSVHAPDHFLAEIDLRLIKVDYLLATIGLPNSLSADAIARGQKRLSVAFNLLSSSSPDCGLLTELENLADMFKALKMHASRHIFQVP